ncbi:hypothetical protein JXA05_04080 [Candidatus Peregrinibacteria bacterium]|nr:hypothetical protein [Candidatus Peregrinibacteria bacterium]
MVDEKPKAPSSAIAEAEKPITPAAIAEDIRVKVDTQIPPQQNSPDVKVVKLFRGEALTSKEITPELVKEVSDYYRWLFSNTYQYVTCPPCEEQGQHALMTARQAFGTENAFVPLNEMDSDHPRQCPCCQTEMPFIYDPEKLTENFMKKLKESDESFLSVLRRNSDNSIAGLSFAFVTSYLRQFELEWQSRYMYMKEQKPEYQRDPQKFIDCINMIHPEKHLKGHETFLAWNCMSISPEAKGDLMLLMRNMFNAIPPSLWDLNTSGEVKKGSPAHAIFKTVGGHDGTNFFEEDSGDILIGGNVGRVKDVFNMSPDEFRKLKETLAGKKMS